MKRLIAIIFVAVIALVGCQGANNDDTTRKDGTDTENMTFEKTRYNDDNIAKNKRFTERKDREDRLNERNDKDENEYNVSKEAADRITDEVEEINNAYVITTRNNAYVAATLKERNKDDNRTNVTDDRKDDANVKQNDRHDDDLTDEVKEQVADIVQSVDDNIDNVYVTTSPDFINLSQQYADDLDAGKPVRGFFDQIGDAIERIFPQERTEGRHTR